MNMKHSAFCASTVTMSEMLVGYHEITHDELKGLNTLSCCHYLSTRLLFAGHWKLGHTPKNFLLGQVVILSQMSLFTFFRAAPGLFESFGFLKDQPVFMSIVLFQLLQGPLDEVSQFFGK